jgi:RNA polymerase sigma factor (sigma-70 family)
MTLLPWKLANRGSHTQTSEFEELALPLPPSLHNVALWPSRNAADAEDLVQETFLKALRGFASFETGTNFKTWIFRILRNTFLTSRRCTPEYVRFQRSREEPRGEIGASTARNWTEFWTKFFIQARFSLPDRGGTAVCCSLIANYPKQRGNVQTLMRNSRQRPGKEIHILYRDSQSAAGDCHLIFFRFFVKMERLRH